MVSIAARVPCRCVFSSGASNPAELRTSVAHLRRAAEKAQQGPVRAPGASFRSRRVRTHTLVAEAQSGTVATASEEAAWKRRQEESQAAAAEEEEEERMLGDSEQWRWTLNWNAITPELIVGSCPRSAPDIDTIADVAKATAIVNLQSDVCFEALQIPFPELRERAVERGVFLARVPIRDFDHGDQSAMLPEAVRVVNLLVTKGHRVYIHCTAGINRATLVVLAYLYFIQGLRRDEALKMVKQGRPVANPYLDCLTEAKRRLLEGRDEELTALATEIYEERCSGVGRGDASSDWSGAQARALARSFRKYLEVDMGMVDTERAILEARFEAEGSQGGGLPGDLQAQLAEAKALVEEKRSKITQLRELVEQWAKEEALATARAQELEDGLQRAHQAQAAAQAAALAAAQAAAKVTSDSSSQAVKVTGDASGQAGESNGRAVPAAPVGVEEEPVAAAAAEEAKLTTNGVATKVAVVAVEEAEEEEVPISEHDDWECDVVTRTCSEPTRDE